MTARNLAILIYFTVNIFSLHNSVDYYLAPSSPFYECALLAEGADQVVVVIRNCYCVYLLDGITRFTARFDVIAFGFIVTRIIRHAYSHVILPIQEVCSCVACSSASSFSRWGMRVAEYAMVKPTAMWKVAAMMQAAICEGSKMMCTASAKRINKNANFFFSQTNFFIWIFFTTIFFRYRKIYFQK